MLLKSAVAMALLAAASTGARASAFDTEVESLNGLLGYYPFTTSSQGNSVVHRYTGVLENGAMVGGPGSGPPVNDPASSALVLANGSGGMQDMISAGKKPLVGKIATRGSVVAWINLGDLPSNQGRIFSIAGESSGGDDFDLQIDGNNQLCFYTDGGSSTCDPTPFTAADFGVWHLITATFKAGGKRSVFVDGKMVARSTAGGHSANQSPFYVGESPLFTGRYFVGSIGDVAVYKTTLSTKDAKALWASRKQ
jgi:hypothetical protein